MISKIVEWFTGVPTIVWVVLGAIAVFGGWSYGMFQFGANYQERIDDVAALKRENAIQAAVIAENTRQKLAVDAIQANDTTRAVLAEEELSKLQQGLIHDVPPDDRDGLDRDAVERVRKFRVNPLFRPAKRTGAAR